MKSMIQSGALLRLAALLLLAGSGQAAADARPNVLMIICDDLNHWVGHHFKQHGYTLLAAGKVHSGIEDLADAYGRRGAAQRARTLEEGGPARQAWAILDGDDAAGEDELAVRWIVDQLGREHEKPFFMIAGLYKPHLKWNIPKKYFDLYPLEDIRLPPIKPGWASWPKTRSRRLNRMRLKGTPASSITTA